MDNQDEIPSGIASVRATHNPPAESIAGDREEERAINQTNILDELTCKQPQINPPRTQSHFRHKTTREESRSLEKIKNKATSQYNNLKEKIKEEHLIPKKSEAGLKKHKQSVNLPHGIQKLPVKKIDAPAKELHSKSHHFNRKDYHNEQIIKDIGKHPIKYKIMCEVFGCKPDVAFEMNKDEARYIQQGYMKKKGMEYLREGNSRARYNYIRDRRVHTESNPQKSQSHSTHKLNPRGSKSQKLLKLTAKEAIEGKLVYEKVRKHLKEGEKSQNFFKHLNSQQSIDRALVNFLKTKIKRAEMELK